MRDRVILIFAKAPDLGMVKTRLIPLLGSCGAAQFYRFLLYRLVLKFVNNKLGDMEIWCAPDSVHPDFQCIQTILGCPLLNQVGNDLGERMSYAIENALQRYRHVILVGTDCPEMSPGYMQQAIICLNQGMDAVLGPAEDGGYVLLGLNKTAPCLFDGMQWGTGEVLETTRSCFIRLGWKWQELHTLWDVDRPEDLGRLKGAGILY